jgi:hypothetical protein
MSKRAGVRRLGVLIVAAAAVAMALFVGTAKAATIPVHNTADLVAAVASGNPGDVILLDANVQYSPGGPLNIKRNLTIETDPAQLAIPGNRAGIISGGSVAGGAGDLDPTQNNIINVGAGETLTLSNVLVTGTVQGNNGANGAIVVIGGAPAAAGGNLLMDHSLISGNTSNGLDLKGNGTATVTDSTITGSIGGFDGVLLSNAASASFNEDTIASNTGNGIDNAAPGSTATVNNTILSGNGGGIFTNCAASLGLSGSHSGSSDSSCGATITTGGFNNVSAGLISLANNGGPTNTLALSVTSPAINHGTAAPTGADDQRGFARDSSPDIGAFELPPTLMVIKHVSGPALPSAWTISVTGNGFTANPASFPGKDAPGQQVTVGNGQAYTVGESGGPAGYNLTTQGNCTGPVNAGTANPATCTLTNTATGTSLLVQKFVNGPDLPSAFMMTVTDTTTNTVLAPSPFAGSNAGTSVNVPAGDTYSVSEGPAALVANYNAVQTAGCSGTATVNGSVTCTVTNTAKPTALLVKKIVVGPDPPSAFQMTVTDTTTNTALSPSPFPGSNAGTTVMVPAGDSYTVSEGPAALVANYTPAQSPGCSGTATANGSVTCTVTNTSNCPQPPNSGQQPAPGPPGSSSNTCVNTSIAATILVTAPLTLNTGTLTVGQSSPLMPLNPTVYTNNPTGYQLSVRRTPFFSPTDIPMTIQCSAVSSPLSFLAPFTGAPAPVPTSGPDLNIGKSTQYTTVSGDTWPCGLVVGPVPYGPPAGNYESTVTLTAVGI